MKALETEQKNYSKAFKEELIIKVVYQNLPLKTVARDYGLPNLHMFKQLGNLSKKKLEKGERPLLPNLITI